jgi:HAD superfamily hydrolase (TIGR01509 family)
MSPRRALLCDLDGTLADTLPVLRDVYERFVTDRDAHPCAEEFERLNGIPIRDAVEKLRSAHGWRDPLEVLVLQYEDAIDLAYAAAPAQPGARLLLSTARENGWRCAVVTSGRRARAEAWLKESGLDDIVDTLVAAEDVTQGKPDPEPYRLAVERLSADLSSTVAVEDSPIGVASATGAGVRTFFLAPDGSPAPAGVAGRVRSLSALIRAIDQPDGVLAPGRSTRGPLRKDRACS